MIPTRPEELFKKLAVILGDVLEHGGFMLGDDGGDFFFQPPFVLLAQLVRSLKSRNRGGAEKGKQKPRARYPVKCTKTQSTSLTGDPESLGLPATSGGGRVLFFSQLVAT